MRVEGIDINVSQFANEATTLSLSPQVDELTGRMKFLERILENYAIISGELENRHYAPEKLEELDLSTLRIVHAISNPYTFPEMTGYTSEEYMGSIVLTTRRSPQRKVLADTQNPSYSYIVSSGETTWYMDFVPVGSTEKVERLAQPSMFLGSTDLVRTLEEKRKDTHKPSVVVGFTNSDAAYFAIRNWGFKLTEAVKMSVLGNTEEINGKEAYQLLENIKSGKVKVREDEDIMFGIFAKTDDIFTDDHIRSLEHTKDILFRRAQATKQTTAQDINEYEKELRILAIKRNIEALELERIESLLQRAEQENSLISSLSEEQQIEKLLQQFTEEGIKILLGQLPAEKSLRVNYTREKKNKNKQKMIKQSRKANRKKR